MITMPIAPGNAQAHTGEPLLRSRTATVTLKAPIARPAAETTTTPILRASKPLAPYLIPHQGQGVFPSQVEPLVLALGNAGTLPLIVFANDLNDVLSCAEWHHASDSSYHFSTRPTL